MNISNEYNFCYLKPFRDFNLVSCGDMKLKFSFPYETRYLDDVDMQIFTVLLLRGYAYLLTQYN